MPTEESVDDSSSGLETETSMDLDSERQAVKEQARAASSNVWGSLVEVLYGIEREDNMKLNPQHFLKKNGPNLKSLLGKREESSPG